MKILLLTLLTIAATASAATPKKSASAKPAEPPCCREGLPPGKYSEKSIYTLDAHWTADVGKVVKLDALRGRPQVIALFFTHCEHSCPLIVADMKSVEKGLPAKARAKVDFLMVSIDPARDTPEVLHAFREKHQLGMQHWSLLHGASGDVQKLAAMIGFRYFPGSNTQFAHSLLLTVVNGKGEIVFQKSGLNGDMNDLIGTLVRLTK